MSGTGDPYVSLAELAARVPDGASVALPPDYSLAPSALVRALIRRRIKDLRVVGVPVAGYPADLLIGAGAVAAIETSAVTLGEAGRAPSFTRAAEAGAVRVIDATCQAVHAALQAAEKGAPFAAVRGIIGSDILAARPDWRVIDNPFGTDDPVVVVPALRPDVALFHARWGDRAGNVWVGRHRELATIAHAAQTSLVTVEEVLDDDLTADEVLAPGAIGGVYIGALARAPKGAWPLGVTGLYRPDGAHMAEYARAAATSDGLARYLDRHVLSEAP